MTRFKLQTRSGIIVLAAVGSICATEILSDTTKAQASPLFEGVVLPYEGHGSVAVLNNGLVAIEIGKESSIDECGRMEFFKQKGFYLAPDMTNLSLIETADGEWSLLNGAATPTNSHVVPFDEDAVPNYETARQSLVSIEGKMSLGFDAEKNIYHLEIRDPERDKGFSFSFRAASAESGQRGCSGSCSCNAGPCPTHGDTCSISCTNKCCVCYCSGSTPVCNCTSNPPKYIAIPSASTPVE